MTWASAKPASLEFAADSPIAGTGDGNVYEIDPADGQGYWPDGAGFDPILFVKIVWTRSTIAFMAWLPGQWIALGLILPCLALERLFFVYRRKQLISAAMLVDYMFPALYSLVFAMWTGIALYFYRTLLENVFPYLGVELVSRLPVAAQFVVIFIVRDFTSYCNHYLRHKIPWIWYCHKVHHSQRDLNPMTQLRVHPLEVGFASLFDLAALAFLGGDPAAWFMFGIVHNFLGYLQHANLRLYAPALEKVLVLPRFHRIHHGLEKKYYDRNFGERLVIWDWMFGTAYFPEKDEYPETGLAGWELPQETGRTPWHLAVAWGQLVLQPFREMSGSVARVLAKAART